MGDFFAGPSSRSVQSTIEALEPRRLLAVTAGSEPTNLFGLNGALYFSANDSNTGFELWKTDGTEGGTVLVKDILPSPESSLPGEFASVGNTLYFAIRGAESLQLWKSDGAEGGTVRVKDLTKCRR